MRICVCFLILAVVAFGAAADVTGTWTGTFAQEGGDSSGAHLILKQSGNSVTGSGGPNQEQQWPLANGKLEGNKLTGDVQNPNGTVYKLDLVVDGNRMKGSATASREGQTVSATMDLTRAK
jgi:hypothetical protein